MTANRGPFRGREHPEIFVDLKSSFGLKRVLGDSRHSHLLIDFLNHLFKGEKQITQLTYHDTDGFGEPADFRSKVFDIHCTTGDGVEFLIETQRSNHLDFTDRAFYYVCLFIQQWAESHSYGGSMPEIHYIGICDFKLCRDFPSVDTLETEDTEDESAFIGVGNVARFTYLEIPEINLELKDLRNGLDKWYYLFKHMGSLEKIPPSLYTGVFREVFKLATISEFSRDQYARYRSEILAYQNEFSIVNSSRAIGESLGERAEYEKSRKEMEKVISNLLAIPELSITNISKATGWSEKAIQKIGGSVG